MKLPVCIFVMVMSGTIGAATRVKSLAVLPSLPGAASPVSDTTAVIVTLGTAACPTDTTSGKTKLFMPGFRTPEGLKVPPMWKVQVATCPVAEQLTTSVPSFVGSD